QQTLRATIEWSYQLLEPAEQRLFELLSAFSGISFDALEAVAGSIEHLRGSGVDTRDGLASLAGTSLIRHAEAGGGAPRRAMQEATLRTSLARALMAMDGYTQEVEDAYIRALELFEEQRDFPQLFPVLRGLATFYNYRAEFDKGAELGQEILRLADAQNDTGMRADGHLVLGSSLALQHDLHGGLDHLDEAIASFESERHRPRRFRLGNNPG